MARDGIKTPKDTNFIVGILERENHGGKKAKRKAHDVQMAGDCFRQPSKIASVETKKRLWKLLSKAQMVEATGFEPAESPGPKETYTDFLLDLQGFSGLFCPKTMLSGAPRHTVST